MSETLYEVEAVLSRRQIKGSVEYLVKWLNFEAKDNSWVLASDMECPTLIDSFETDHIMHETLNPFQRGFKAESLRDARIDVNAGICFLVRFYGKTIMEWVPNKVIRKECPHLLIEYYENRIEWIN